MTVRDNDAPSRTTTGAESMDDEVPSRQSSLPAGATQEPSLAEQAIAKRSRATAKRLAQLPTGWSILALQLILLALFIAADPGRQLPREAMEDAGPRLEDQPGARHVGGGDLVDLPFGEFKFGPDLAGGITLVYELADASDGRRGSDAQAATSARAERTADSLRRPRVPARRPDRRAQETRSIRTAPRKSRFASTARPSKSSFRETGQDEMEYVKRRITDMGQLEFRITADSHTRRQGPADHRAGEADCRPAQKNVRASAGTRSPNGWPTTWRSSARSIRKTSGLVKRMAG